MSAKNLDTDVSKFMSYALRHAPQEAGLTLDNEGWANFVEVASAVLARFDVGEDDLKKNRRGKSKATLHPGGEPHQGCPGT